MQALLDQPFGGARAPSPFPAPQKGRPPSTLTPVSASLPAATAAPVHALHPTPTPSTPAAAAAAAALTCADEQGMYGVCSGLVCS